MGPTEVAVTLKGLAASQRASIASHSELQENTGLLGRWFDFDNEDREECQPTSSALARW